MNAQDLVKYVDDSENMGILDLETPERSEITNQILNYFKDQAEKSKSLILEKMSGEDSVKIIALVEAMILAEFSISGRGQLLIMAKLMDNSFTGFVHTVVLTVLGILIDEEVV